MSATSAPRHVVQVEVATLSIRIEADTADDLALVHRLLGSALSTRPPDATIRLVGDAPTLPVRDPDFEGPYGDHWDADGVHSFRHHWGFAAVVTDDLAVMGGAASGHERWVTVRNSMLFAVARLFLTRGLLVLHGAGIRRGDMGLVAIGESGSGKSTLAYVASRAGWGVLGDDMVVIDPTGPELVLRGIPRVPSVPGEIAAAAQVVGDTVPRDTRSRMELVEHEMDHGSAPLAGVIVCAHGTAEGSVTEIDAVTALHALVPAFVLADLPGPLRRWFPVASRLANGVCVQLGHAASAEDRLLRTEALLDEVARRCRTGHDPDRHRP